MKKKKDTNLCFLDHILCGLSNLSCHSDIFKNNRYSVAKMSQMFLKFELNCGASNTHSHFGGEIV